VSGARNHQSAPFVELPPLGVHGNGAELEAGQQPCRKSSGAKLGFIMRHEGPARRRRHQGD
jgi:hypothetical protein